MFQVRAAKSSITGQGRLVVAVALGRRHLNLEKRLARNVMSIAGAAIAKWRGGILDRVSRFVNAIDGEDQAIECLTANVFDLQHLVDVIGRVPLVSHTRGSGEVSWNRVAIIIV